MSVIEINEELVSEVDINAEFTVHGLSISIFVDGEEFFSSVDYETIALIMTEDEDKYPDPVLKKIAGGFGHVARFLTGALGNGR